MNILYLTLYDINDKRLSGVDKKVNGQIKAMRKKGLNVYRIYIKNRNLYLLYKGNESLLKEVNFSNKMVFKITKRKVYYNLVLEFIYENNIKGIIIRYPLSSPYFIRFLRKCKNSGLKVYLEIPTYPYDKELIFSKLGFAKLLIDKWFRKSLHKYIDRIITYSDHEKIFNVKTINISNGIDLDNIRISKETNNNSDILNLIGVASVSIWHGFDRVIKGLSDYYLKNNDKEVFFHIVGNGPEINNLKKITKELSLEKYVVFHGFKDGNELDNLFDKSHIGIGSLAIHRIGLYKVCALKNREYCARGIPFIIASFDEDFPENFEYVLRIPQNDESVDIKKVIEFYDSIKHKNYREEMRQFARENLTWEVKIEPLIKEFLNNKN
ncbi:glycosyltransferase [Thermosipho africanus H17ap60334]|uniref:glycosyltransferase n=1 Tax=Thermosipho africanus TaxID=2421 RepID=UPI00028DD423|nr:glycosyltransferase [Thermosipho africanus]EKF50161.1 glycosyltransferase [Thermosipho africanus H17ap60334]